ncbi:MAG: hypothetical protein U9P81_10090 [Euryarchaeota archaeon]|nr:hypothetical protein [Euryarchaeota archaeon]
MVIYKKKEKNVTDNYPDECGDVYTLTAMESDTKLFNDLESRRLTTSPIPLFASDDWDPFKVALLNVYGILEQPPYCGIGTKTTSYFGAT